MKKNIGSGIAALLMAALVALPNLAAPQAPASQASGTVQEVSWDRWQAAKAKAEANDAAGNFVAALQYYLEYTRQAEGLGDPVRAAWGKNNAAYMIIKMHRQDPTVDLAPARKLLEEGLAIGEATEDCKKIMAMNLEHVKSVLRSDVSGR